MKGKIKKIYYQSRGSALMVKIELATLGRITQKQIDILMAKTFNADSFKNRNK